MSSKRRQPPTDIASEESMPSRMRAFARSYTGAGMKPPEVRAKEMFLPCMSEQPARRQKTMRLMA